MVGRGSEPRWKRGAPRARGPRSPGRSATPCAARPPRPRRPGHNVCSPQTSRPPPTAPSAVPWLDLHSLWTLLATFNLLPPQTHLFQDRPGAPPPESRAVRGLCVPPTWGLSPPPACFPGVCRGPSRLPAWSHRECSVSKCFHGPSAPRSPVLSPCCCGACGKMSILHSSPLVLDRRAHSQGEVVSGALLTSPLGPALPGGPGGLGPGAARHPTRAWKRACLHLSLRHEPHG